VGPRSILPGRAAERRQRDFSYQQIAAKMRSSACTARRRRELAGTQHPGVDLSGEARMARFRSCTSRFTIARCESPISPDVLKSRLQIRHAGTTPIFGRQPGTRHPSTGRSAAVRRAAAVTGIGANQRSSQLLHAWGRFQWQLCTRVRRSNQTESGRRRSQTRTPTTHAYDHQSVSDRPTAVCPRTTTQCHRSDTRWAIAGRVVSARVTRDDPARPTHWARACSAGAFPSGRRGVGHGRRVWQTTSTARFTQLDDDYYVPDRLVVPRSLPHG